MKYLIGNLKMNFILKDFKGYLKNVNKLAKNTNNVVGVMVPYPYLNECKKYLKKASFGAQNCHYKDNGAFTGEVSVNMLNDFNVNMCIVGHSERRAYYNETDDEINKKVIKLLENNIKPIFCFGETLKEKEDGKTKKVLKNQITKALVNVENVNNIIFAYEPVWAIGTGLTPTIKEIASITKYIKGVIAKLYNINNDAIILLYGGSMNDKNASDILSVETVDGGLIGGACLNIEKFEKIINAK